MLLSFQVDLYPNDMDPLGKILRFLIAGLGIGRGRLVGTSLMNLIV